jgi:hypothetical protein
MKDSHLAREAFAKLMVEAGDDPLAIIQGTSNRQVALLSIAMKIFGKRFLY